MNKYLFSIFSLPKYLFIFFAILCIGIFFRTYHFHDFLRFNADQSRDAGIVSGVVSGDEDIPLLGPKAGGTDFRVGPAFYYFQIVSAKIFGDAPDKMAYPDLFFSILALPLSFFFFRKYFDTRTAIFLTALFAFSAYAIKYSRFAWNPNSLPFFTLLLLYGLHEMMTTKEEGWKQWTMITGIACGIGIQLHSLSLLLFPMITAGVLGYLIYHKRKHVIKMIVVILSLVTILNIPQIVSEVRTGGENTKAFFDSIGTKEKKGDGMFANIRKNIVCFSQNNTYVLSSYDSSDTCEMKMITRGYGLPAFTFGFLLFFFGHLLSIRVYKREVLYEKRVFLALILSYITLTFLLLIPLANEISMRFFLVVLFMPFFFLGIWLLYIREMFPKVGSFMVFGILCILISMNIFSLVNTSSTYQKYLTDSDEGMDNVLLREVELASNFILAHSEGTKVVSVTGDTKYLFKALKSMNYFTQKSGVKLVQQKQKNIHSALPVFLVDNTKNREKILQEKNVDTHLVFGRFTIFFLKP